MYIEVIITEKHTRVILRSAVSCARTQNCTKYQLHSYLEFSFVVKVKNLRSCALILQRLALADCDPIVSQYFLFFFSPHACRIIT